MTPYDQPAIVVDTNVVSYIYRDDPIGSPYLARMDGHRAVISFQTYEEVLFGVLISNWGEQRINRLLHHINTNYDVLGSNGRLAVVCANLRAESRRIGRELRPADAWIAATALLLDCPLLSHDRDFGSPPGLEVIRFP